MLVLYTHTHAHAHAHSHTDFFVRRMPVPTVGLAMFRDALAYHDKRQGEGEGEGQSEEATAAAQDVMIADNTAIYRLCQVNCPL